MTTKLHPAAVTRLPWPADKAQDLDKALPSASRTTHKVPRRKATSTKARDFYYGRGKNGTTAKVPIYRRNLLMSP